MPTSIQIVGLLSTEFFPFPFWLVGLALVFLGLFFLFFLLVALANWYLVRGLKKIRFVRSKEAPTAPHHAQAVAARKGFEPFETFEVQGSPVKVLMMIWRDAAGSKYCCMYSFPDLEKEELDFVTVFQSGVSLTTASAVESCTLPQPPGQYLQSFSVSVEEQLARHEESEKYLLDHGTRLSVVEGDFEERLHADLHKQHDFVRAIPFWPLYGFSWNFLRKNQWHGKPVSQLHREGLVRMPGESENRSFGPRIRSAREETRRFTSHTATSSETTETSVRLRAPRRKMEGIFFLIFGAIFLTASNDAHFECERGDSADVCTLTRTSLFGKSFYSYDLEDVLRAEVEDDDDSRRTVLIVQADDGERKIPFARQSSGFIAYEKKVRQINEFLADPSVRSLSVRESSLFWILPLSAAFLFGGLRTAFGPVRYVDCRVDPISQTFHVDCKGWIFTRRNKYSLHQISGIETEFRGSLLAPWEDATQEYGDDAVYRLVLVLKSGTRRVLITSLRSFDDADSLREELLESMSL